MKKLFFLLTLSILSLTSVQAQKNNGASKELRHVVLFTFKSTSNANSVDSVVKAFNHLYGTVPQVKKME